MLFIWAIIWYEAVRCCPSACFDSRLKSCDWFILVRSQVSPSSLTSCCFTLCLCWAEDFFFLSRWQFAAFQNNFQVLYFLQQRRRRQFHLTCRLGPKKKKKKTRGWRQRGQRALIPTLNSSSHIPWILTAVNLDTALIWKIEVVGWESWQRWRCADRFWNEHIHPAVLTVETALEAAPKPVPALSELMHEMWPWLH